MPTISAVASPTGRVVRVITSWADTPSATHATVFREDCLTGERVQLRPYVSYNSNGYLALSCGMALFWDTEVPLDRCVRYYTQAQNALGATIMTPAPPLVADTYTRAVANQWGSTDNGLPYTTVGGVPANYNVNGTQGVMNTVNTGVEYSARLANIGPNLIASGVFAPRIVAATQPFEQKVRFRHDGTNFYEMNVQFTTSGGIDLYLVRNVSVLQAVGTAMAYTAATFVAWKIQAWGNQLAVKIWDATLPEPTTSQINVTDSTLPGASTDSFHLAADRIVGNTNGTIDVRFDSLLIVNPYATPVPIEARSSDITMASSGVHMLRDPTRPCSDVQAAMRWTGDPACDPAKGIVFARMEGESYGANTQNLQPFNSRRPTPVTRERGDAETSLVLVTKTFADRDAVLELLRPGGTLLWQSPPEYGIPDRYIQVGAATVTRYNNDHRYQPRVITLPYVAENRPEGPTLGICGARVKDLCDIYSSWNAVTTAQLSFLDLLKGRASTAGPSIGTARRWIDVKTGFANWLGVETTPHTWKTLRDGA